jgi:hypothetical protein
VTIKFATLLAPPEVAWIATAVFAATALVETVNVARFAPAGTVTVESTVAAVVLLLASVTVVLAGTFVEKVTVPMTGVPPFTVAASSWTLASAAALTVRVAAVVVPPPVAERETDVSAVTAFVVTLKVPTFAPAPMLTDAGMGATAAFALVSVTDNAAAAGPVSLTVPVLVPPPPTVLGLSVRPATEAGLRVRVAVLVRVPKVALKVTVVFKATAFVATERVTLFSPAGTTTLAGRVAAMLLLDSMTVVFAVTGPSIDTLAVTGLPPATDPAERVSADREATFTISAADLATWL